MTAGFTPSLVEQTPSWDISRPTLTSPVDGASAAPVPLLTQILATSVYGVWDVTDGSTRWQEPADPLTTPANDTQSLGTWQDISGNGRHWRAGNRPTVVDAGGGVFEADFNGTANYLNLAVTLTTPVFYMCWAFQTPASPANVNRAISLADNTALQDFNRDDHGIPLTYLTGSPNKWGPYRNGAMYAGQQLTADTRYVFETCLHSTGAFSNANGGADVTEVYAAKVDFDVAMIRMGANANSAAGDRSAVDFTAGIIRVGTIPSAPERALYRQWCAEKGGVTLS